jgi:hypothetical protein
MGSHLSILEFDTFQDDDIEIELFKRYNRNTKPLEKHEISMATFYSKTSQFITNYLNYNTSNEDSDRESKKIVKIYNITKDRKDKQKNHQELCIILSIINNGPNIQYKDGVEIANKYLEQRANLFKNNIEEDLDLVKERFKGFNELMLKLSGKVEYPFSSSIYRDEEKRSVKFHTGVSMVLATIFYYFDINLNNTNLLSEIRDIMNCSPLGDPTYNASSTNMRNLITYIFKRNRVHDRVFSALTFKGNLSREIKDNLDII